MRSFDLSPLFRASVGFDNLTRVLDSVTRLDDAHFAYPPYNIVKTDADNYRITFAVAGFAPEEIDVQVENNTLTVKGRPNQEPKETVYLHHGIAGRAFERRFELAAHIRVDTARLENGLLHVDLKREVPEALKPRKISVNATKPVPVLQAAE
ncbi:MAG: Hsp20 family protein [Rhodospirillaceae bacterium]|nr:MAG: Hsp20 family protein [Rhodospirillaceae bacterium]